jgi:SAM-dependent methyltransferase
MPGYQDPKTAQKYLDFLNSVNGQIQQQVLFYAIRYRLPDNKAISILDAGCGQGWLTGVLKKDFVHLKACDASEFLIRSAKITYPRTEFIVAPLDKPLPYPERSFDFVILNMAAPDLENLSLAFRNLSAVIKPGGKLIMTVPNPKYTYPVAEWKRSLADFLLRRKPTLKIKIPPASGTKIQREFGKSKIYSYFYTLDDYINAATASGFSFATRDDIRSNTDSPNFDLNYQLFRYPLFQLLEFKKL